MSDLFASLTAPSPNPACQPLERTLGLGKREATSRTADRSSGTRGSANYFVNPISIFMTTVTVFFLLPLFLSLAGQTGYGS